MVKITKNVFVESIVKNNECFDIFSFYVACELFPIG